MKRSSIKNISDKQRDLIAYRAKMKPIIFEAQGKKCKRCGCEKPDWRGWQLVHIIPLSLGGTDDRGNLEVDCAPCHMTNPELHNLREV